MGQWKDQRVPWGWGRGGGGEARGNADMGEQSITHLSKAEYTLPRRLALMHVNSKKALRRPGVPGGVRGTQLCFSVGTRREPRGEGAARGGVRGFRRSGARDGGGGGGWTPPSGRAGWLEGKGRADGGAGSALGQQGGGRRRAGGGARGGGARGTPPSGGTLSLMPWPWPCKAQVWQRIPPSAFMGSPRPCTNSVALSKVRAPTCLAVGGGVRLPRAAVPGEASSFSTRPGRKCPSLTQASAGA